MSEHVHIDPEMAKSPVEPLDSRSRSLQGVSLAESSKAYMWIMLAERRVGMEPDCNGVRRQSKPRGAGWLREFRLLGRP